MNYNVRTIFHGSALILLLLIAASLQLMAAPPTIIPAPAQIKEGSGTFTLSSNSTIYSEGADLKNVIAYLNARISPATGFTLNTANAKATGTFHFLVNSKADAQLGTEGYRLNVTQNNVSITANTAAGIFYGD